MLDLANCSCGHHVWVADTNTV